MLLLDSHLVHTEALYITQAALSLSCWGHKQVLLPNKQVFGSLFLFAIWCVCLGLFYCVLTHPTLLKSNNFLGVISSGKQYYLSLLLTCFHTTTLTGKEVVHYFYRGQAQRNRS